MSGRHGVQYMAQCVACAALTLVVRQQITNLSLQNPWRSTTGAAGMMPEGLNLAHYTLHPSPYTLHTTPFTLHAEFIPRHSVGKGCQKSSCPWALWLSNVNTVFKDGFEAIYPLHHSGVVTCGGRRQARPG